MNRHTTHRISGFNFNVIDDTAMSYVLEDIEPGDDGYQEGAMNKRPKTNEDGSPQVQEVAVKSLVMQEHGEQETYEWVFETDSRVKLITMLCDKLDDQQKHTVMQHLAGGIIIAPANAIPAAAARKQNQDRQHLQQARRRG